MSKTPDSYTNYYFCITVLMLSIYGKYLTVLPNEVDSFFVFFSLVVLVIGFINKELI
jgi:hypothetical protein